MEITIKGDPKEIAALVLEIQEWQKRKCPGDEPRHTERAFYADSDGNYRTV